MPFDCFLTLMGGNAAHDGQQEHGLQECPSFSFLKKITFSLRYLWFVVDSNLEENR